MDKALLDYTASKVEEMFCRPVSFGGNQECCPGMEGRYCQG